MFAYLLGETGGPELEEQVKIFKKMSKSHQKVPAIELCRILLVVVLFHIFSL